MIRCIPRGRVFRAVQLVGCTRHGPWPFPPVHHFAMSASALADIPLDLRNKLLTAALEARGTAYAPYRYVRPCCVQV